MEHIFVVNLQSIGPPADAICADVRRIGGRGGGARFEGLFLLYASETGADGTQRLACRLAFGGTEKELRRRHYRSRWAWTGDGILPCEEARHSQDGEDPVRYRHVNINCDVLIVGTGPTGVAAALKWPARHGDDVVIVEQDSEPGGTLLYDPMEIEDESSDVWLAEALVELTSLDNVRVMLNSAAVGYYINTVPTLKFGKVRYGIMLHETGVIIDDGVFVRMADDHFLIDTTSGHAERIAGWLEEWHQCELTDLDLVLNPVTSQWAVATVAGPNSRAVLQTIPGMMDLSTENFPHMSFASGEFEDSTPYRIQRVSFSGEQSYELRVPANRANEFLDRIWQSGSTYDVGMFGIEALMVLRMEKGFLHVGVDTDGTTNPFDIGFGHIVERKVADFVGARSLIRPDDKRSDRRQLIGFELAGDGGEVLAGAHFVAGTDSQRRSEGFVTSACVSPTLGKTIGLGLLERGFERKGEQVRIFDDGETVSATIVDTCFYDPEAERMRG